MTCNFPNSLFPSSCGQQHKHKKEQGFLKGEKSLARNESWTHWGENKYYRTEHQLEISISIQQNTFFWINCCPKNESGARSTLSFLICRLCICESSWIPGKETENQQIANRIKGGCKLLFSFCCKLLFNFPNTFHFFSQNAFFPANALDRGNLMESHSKKGSESCVKLFLQTKWKESKLLHFKKEMY